MLRKHLILLLALLSCGGMRDETPRLVAAGQHRPAKAEAVVVYRSAGYVNNVVITRFKQRFYCMWQESARDEDTPDTRICLSTSTDGREWSAPETFIGPSGDYFASPGGWLAGSDTLTALINYVYAPDRTADARVFYTSTTDGAIWSTPAPVILSDDTPVQGLFEQDPLRLPSGRTVGAVHFSPGNQLCPVYTDDPSGVKGWKRAAFPAGEGIPLEPSVYPCPDGNLVMFMRDQASSFVKLYSISKDRGESWSAPSLTNIPDSRSKQCTGVLPDGRTFWVGNPTGNKSRTELVMGVSRDGYLYEETYLLGGPSELPAQRAEGKYKTLGYNYPKAFVEGSEVWIGFSVNKEDVSVLRLEYR